jgi:hypothetical protein
MSSILSPVAIHPVQAEMPGFLWEQAAIYQFTEENLALFEMVRGAPHDTEHRRKARELAAKYNAQEMFNVTTLKPYYEAALALSAFIAINSALKFGKTRPDNYRFKGAPAPLLALCALVLFVSNWDMNTAIAKFAKILAAPDPADILLGNVIGLNPFHDYASWHLVIVAGEVAAHSPNGFDYPVLLAATEARLHEQYRVWKIQAT